MIQTSYFRRPGLPLDRCVSIARRAPNGYVGVHYPNLTPSRELLKAYKEGILTWGMYTESYQKSVLARLDPVAVAADLDGQIMCCWEKDREHCHRRLVAEWLEVATGEPVPEWEPSEVRT